MPSESKLEWTLESAEASDRNVAAPLEIGPLENGQQENYDLSPDSTAKYARDAAAALIEGAPTSKPSPAPTASSVRSSHGGSGARAAFVPVREQKTIISKRPASAPSSATPVRSPLVREIGESLVGQMLDHFELVEFVGGGGMGAVFRAIDTHLGRDVAVKVLSRDQNDEETIRRFKNEAQSTARLDHPNIARVYYVGEALGWNYIVFEFIEGANIRDLIYQRGAPLPLEEAISYVLQVAQALEHASQRDVVHRDIKPSNILITPQGVAKLVDMGLARLHQVESPDNDLTASGVTLGTFDYISPEQARDPRSADVRSDLYSLGCTFYYMLTGRPPFVDGTVLQKLLSHTSDEPPDVRLYRPDLPEDVTDVLSKLLAKNPRDRFQQPADLIAQLAVLAEHYGWADVGRTSAVWVAAPETAFTKIERWLPILLPCLLLVVLAIVLGTPWQAADEEPFEAPKPVLAAEEASDEAAKKSSPSSPSSRSSTSPPTTDSTKAAATDGATDSAADGPKASERPSATDVAEGAAGSNNASEPPQPDSEANEKPPLFGAGVEAIRRSAPRGSDVTAFGPGEKANPLSIAAPASKPTADATDSSLDDAATPTSSSDKRTSAATQRLGIQQPGAQRSGDEQPERSEVSSAISRVGAAGLQLSSGESTGASGAAVSVVPKKLSPDAETRRLIVGATEASPGADAFVVASLAAASRYAADYPKIETIELWFDGPRLEAPISLGGKRMTVRAGKGYKPVVVLRPAAVASSDGGFIQLSGGDFTFSGIDWWCELPASGYGSWSLFQLDRAVGIDLTDCTITLVNADENGRDFSTAAAVVEIRPPPVRDPVASEMSGAMPETVSAGGTSTGGMPSTEMPTGGMATSGMAEEGAAYGPTAIRLSRCLVRGETNLVFAERAEPFSLQWSQGLFISNRRLLEIGAVAKEPDWGAPIEVDLSQVTVFAASGLCLYRASSDLAGSGAYSLPLNLDSRYCIFIADPTAPIFEHRLPKRDGFEPSLYVTGIDNFYPKPDSIPSSTQVYWRTGEGASVVDRTIDRRDPKWCSEMNPQRSVLFASPPSPVKPIHTRDETDYQLGAHATNRAANTGGVGGLAGFTPDQLPSAPSAPVMKPSASAP